MPHRKLKRLAKSLPIGRAEFGLSQRGMPRFDLRDPYRLAISMSWPVFAVAMLGLWLTLNLGFALLYVLTRISHTPFKSCAAACNWRVGSC